MVPLIILEAWRKPHGDAGLSPFPVPHIVPPPLSGCSGCNQHHDDLTVLALRRRLCHKGRGHLRAIRWVAVDAARPWLLQSVVFLGVEPGTLGIDGGRSSIVCELKLLVQFIEERLRRSPVLIGRRIQKLSDAATYVPLGLKQMN